jgi:hypothetical protein
VGEEHAGKFPGTTRSIAREIGLTGRGERVAAGTGGSRAIANVTRHVRAPGAAGER